MPSWKPLRWVLLALWLGASALGAVCAATAWLPASREVWGVSLAGVLTVCGNLVLLCLALMSFVLGLVCVIKALVDHRSGPLLLLLPLGLPFVLLCVSYFLQQRFPTRAAAARTAEFSALAERSRPLTSALARYMEEHGRAPAALEELVPGYLAKIPATGDERYPNYYYQAFAGGIPGARLIWYEVGPGGMDPLLEGFRYGSLGPFESAILIVVLDAQGKVIGTDRDRLGSAPSTQPFEAERWRGMPEARAPMLADLAPRLIGLSLEEARALLGTEGGHGSLEEHDDGAPFELSVPCPGGLGNYDYFVYWPCEVYPDGIDGDSVERIGGWLYVRS